MTVNVERHHPTASAETALARFRDRIAVLATMHGKEQAIAPVLEAELGLQVQVPVDFNTDRFGTFTREVKRPGNQLTAARLKAERAIELTGCSIAIASEGSFGPHPVIPYLPCDREIVLLIDRQQELEIVGQAISTETNFSHQVVKTLAEAEAFAQKSRFPEHGLVLMTDPTEDGMPQAHSQIIKGIQSEGQLLTAVAEALQRGAIVQLETDMRAMMNPLRMKVIAAATKDLLTKLQRTCAACGTPGFEIVERKPGLPCGLCYLPTSLTRSVIYQCKRCDYQQEVLFPDQLETADPTHCNYCNP